MLRLSAIVVAEFLVQAIEDEQLRFERLLEQFPVVAVDKEIAIIAAAYRKQFLKRTQRIIIVDCFIAAQAKFHNLTLVTNNRADFPMRDIKVIAP